MHNNLIGNGRWGLTRTTPTAAPPPPVPAIGPQVPAPEPGIHVLAVGDSAAEVVLRAQADAVADGQFFRASYISNDQRGPKPIRLVRPQSEVLELAPREGSERFVLGTDGNTRDAVKKSPLLARRYLGENGKPGLLRGIPVFESFNAGLNGGHSIPPISAIDFDLYIEALLAFLSASLNWIDDGQPDADGGSDLDRLFKGYLQSRSVAAQSWIVAVVFGGSGSCGNAGAQLLPYLLRFILGGMGVNYRLWGVPLGPCAYIGLTPNVMNNYHALMHSLEHMARHGQHRAYANGLVIDSDAPPYDRLFALDDPRLPANRNKVTEQELESFYDRAGLNLHLLLNTGAWNTFASQTANPRQEDLLLEDRIEWLHNVNGGVAGVDKEGLKELAALQQEMSLLMAMESRLSA